MHQVGHTPPFLVSAGGICLSVISQEIAIFRPVISFHSRCSIQMAEIYVIDSLPYKSVSPDFQVGFLEKNTFRATSDNGIY